MPTATYTALATTTVATAVASITFSSIPATYRDLIIVHNNFGTTNNDSNSNFRFNSDTGSNYSRIYAFREASVASGADAGTYLPVFGLRTTLGVSISHIMDYSATDKHKTILTRSNSTDNLVWMSAGRWASTSAINTIQLNAFSGNFAVGLVISLYAIAS
jgi:hypothetical protein